MLADMYPTLLLLGSVIGMYVAYLYGRKTKRFRFSEFALLLAVPVLGSIGLSYFYGEQLIYFFIASSVVGFVLEYGLGLMYHKTLNKRLWTYGEYSVEGYTSLLALPMWGVAGVIFWMLSRSMGL